jgi:uncharacterized repeat protein (TIGR01451 family)
MKLYFFGFFISLNTLVLSQFQIGQSIEGKGAFDAQNQSVSMPDSYTVAVGAPYNDDNGANSGNVRVFQRVGNNWIQKGEDIIGNGGGFGSTVCMSDSNTIAIGAPNNVGSGLYEGIVKVFIWNGINWIEKGNLILGTVSNGSFGVSLSMADSNNIVIGDINGNAGTGLARVYKWDGINWIQKGNDIFGEANGDYFGYSVSMPDSNTIAIDAYGNDGVGLNAGRIKVFSWIGNQWIQKGSNIDGLATLDVMSEVSMPDSNTIAVGSLGSSGKVRVFKWFGNNWSQKGQTIFGEANSDYFGNTISMPDSNTIAVGAYGNDFIGNNSGNARIFTWQNNQWVQKGLNINGKLANDSFGWDISMPNPGIVAISSNNSDDGTGLFKGFVRVYSLNGAQGNIYNDLNQNCLYDTEAKIDNITLTINPGNYVLQTDSNGFWGIELPVGSYNMVVDTIGFWSASCINQQPINILNSEDLYIQPDFGMISTNPCTEPEISIFAPTLRRCFSNQMVYVSACNQSIGIGVLNSSYVDVELDPLLTVTGSSIPYTPQGNNVYRFQTGNINPGQCVNFSINSTVSCNALNGQTLCLEANMYPVEPCVLDTFPSDPPSNGGGSTGPLNGFPQPCTLPWDQSSLSVDGWCANDSIYFTITNTGQPGGGDMECYSPMWITVDGVVTYTDSIMIPGGQTITLSYPGDGQTWILNAEQHPLHPGNSHPNAHVEACGDTTNWTPGLVNELPQNDADPVVDIYCGIVTGSYDPNDKTGYPLGQTSERFIQPNQQLQYVIRFQNTGTDTAFTVVIRDTLDTDLNIFTVTPGVSSHEYNFQMYGPRVLEWTFNNILLPDSTTNEPESNGFVTFNVEQVPNLAQGTEITNDADIYFDFNDPIITNTTTHRIYEGFVAVADLEEMMIETSGLAVYPNPSNGSFTLVLDKEIGAGSYSLYNQLGKIVKTGMITGKKTTIELDLNGGMYYLMVGSKVAKVQVAK